MPLLLAYPQELVGEARGSMKVLERSIAAATMAGLFALAGVTEAPVDSTEPKAKIPAKPVKPVRS